ncbi:UNC93-like protein [Zootermopsis nevadensis]|uniref:UNC93-like protein n=1 Tax=Zootermopsis nevadensis TaxID=136037 RepID=A0A067R4X6_ZOONE|nr:UNC93-like protein [Zootermopsis nevadensis]KDR14271.1 UNC93-like protein [Zootermopsis nevadensis]
MQNSDSNDDEHELHSETEDDVKKNNSKHEETSFTAQAKIAKEAELGVSEETGKQYKPSEKWRIMKNIVVISLAFMVHFTAFQGAGNLQSSVNADEGLGTASLATIYFSLILSNVFLPVVMIRKLGCKWAVAVSFIAYMPYIGAQFYPKFYTMIPAGLLVGLGGGPLWCGKCTYLSVVSEIYSELTNVPTHALVVRFFGVFFMIFQFSQVWGNLISSTVFSIGDSNRTLFSNVSEICGKNFCPGNEANENSNMQRPPEEQIYMVAGIYLACMASACVIVALGVDSLKRYNEDTREGSGKGLYGFQLLAITTKLLKERNQLLIIPITMFLGVEQAFVGADYTAAYVACAWGISNIGYVMICYGITNSISAIGTGSVVKLTGRVPVVCCAFLLHLGIFIGLLTWAPTPDDKIMFFVVTGLWGICDGVWLVQINAYCGILFPSREEAAYSNFRLWESLGFIIAYAYSMYLCAAVKIYILMALLIIGMAGYLTVEWQEKKRI